MAKIKFSHEYFKMPKSLDRKKTRIVAIFCAEFKELSEHFLFADSVFYDKIINELSNYPIPKGKLIVILLCSLNRKNWVGNRQVCFWTTIRRWTAQKEKYYRSLIGQEVEIEVNLKK